ncbi:MAG: hypothetical protein JSW65_03495, partial [Candidatus Bipolaricaulota bacterium]
SRTALDSAARALATRSIEVLGPVEDREGVTLLAKLPDPHLAREVACELRAVAPGGEIDLDGRLP